MTSATMDLMMKLHSDRQCVATETSTSFRYARPYIHATRTKFLQLVDNEEKLMFGFGYGRPVFPVKKIDEEHFSVHFGPHVPPFMFAFQKGENEEEDYICCTYRAYKRMS